jgi:hypothetical protein
MAPTVSKILVGAHATLSIGPYLTGQVSSTGLTEVGSTFGGVQIDPKTEHYMVEIDQRLAAVAAVPKKREVEIKVKLMEATLANLQNALAQTSGALSGTNTLRYDLSAAEVYFQMQLVGKGAGAGTRTITFWKTFIKDMGTWAFQKDAAQALEVTFGVVEETTGSQSDSIRVVDT